ncbi:MAG: hypothetical protein AVDCRST_MAG23-2205 [uncultured Sphingosinicella sp.]|uniref:PRC-barrel domain-containing protein n=1 Tax=uncultured Sphingosinicella sp. TaxID=478748 RepID=A0A6J4U6Y8_9SPHN|nr:PRC-barrel domain-containing protein [uncultured Sphingosinicella sp.]CAA9542288.1 MAG: hypothetical protein AVDCRST_MAG23-2205 [uncultured Sphingosinicella sp.]
MDATAASDEARETLQTFMSARVDNVLVYDTDGSKLGSLYSVQIDRPSGRVEYAVLSFGGFLGLGQSFHPVPFRALSVNEKRGGYTVNIGKQMLQGGPSYRPDTAPSWDASYARRISDYYGGMG